MSAAVHSASYLPGKIESSSSVSAVVLRSLRSGAEKALPVDRKELSDPQYKFQN